MGYRVEYVGCVAGNPLQAWRGTTGETDTVHVPNDVWEDLSQDFGEDLDAAKAWIEAQHGQITTHIVLYHDDELLYNHDAGDDLAAAEPGHVPLSLDEPKTDEDVIEEVPPLHASQKVDG